VSRPGDNRPRGRGKPPSGRGGGYKPGERVGKGTTHGKRGGKTAGGGQTRPPSGCRDTKAMMLALYLTARAMLLLALGRKP
jgi:hypothetical protein